MTPRRDSRGRFIKGSGGGGGGGGVGFVMSLSGLEDFELYLKRFPDETLHAAGGGLYRHGEHVMARSKDEFVPVDLGPLRDSGYVSPPEIDGRQVSVEIGYGGAAAAYALAVHEHLSDYSPRSWVAAEASGAGVHFSPPGHGPKYLEKPVLEESGNMLDAIAADVRSELGL